MKDIKYIIKRIIIGTGIALAVLFMKQNVFAYEWTTEGDVNLEIPGNQISVQGYGIENDTYYSAPSYPVTGTVKRFFAAVYTDSDYVQVSNYDIKRVVYPRFITGYKISFPNYVFEPDINYYVILPVPYTSSQYTSLSLNVSENYVIDENNYTGSTGVSITSALFAMNVENDYLLTNAYPYIYYFKISFTVSEERNDVVITVGDIDTTSTRLFTAFNTYSFTNYIIHSTWNSNCTSYNSNRNCYNTTNSSLKPLLYSHIAGSIFPDDGNDNLTDVTDDIKTQINNIIDGQFSDDLNFPYINGGGELVGDNEYTLQDLLIFPLNFLKGFVQDSSECVGPTIPLPGWLSNYNFTLPCATNFLSTILPVSLISFIKQIFGVIVGYYLICHLYNDILLALSPDDLKLVDAWLI